MAKKPKVELTLEELQAKKSKHQRGWVRFCAVLLAVVLTLGIFGLASQGDPKVVEVYPSVVRAQTKTVVQKQDIPQTEPSDTNSDDDSNTSAPSTSDDEGGILDTLFGLLGSIDLSSLAGKLDLNGLGITIAGGIQTAKDSLLNIIDQIEAAISGKPTISHDAVEYDFDANVDRGDEALRQELVEKINAATAPGVGYTVSRIAMLAEGGSVNIGAQTETVNNILANFGMSLDTIVGEFNGMKVTESGDPDAIMYRVAKGKTAEEAVAAAKYDASYANYGLIPTQLKADDISINAENTFPEAGVYMFTLKNVDNPNRRADCGLTRFTSDYLVQNEVAARIQASAGITEVASSPLKLTDLETKYTDIMVMVQFDENDHLIQVDYMYNVNSKFTVRTNTVQIKGTNTITAVNTYSEFIY